MDNNIERHIHADEKLKEQLKEILDDLYDRVNILVKKDKWSKREKKLINEAIQRYGENPETAQALEEMFAQPVSTKMEVLRKAIVLEMVKLKETQEDLFLDFAQKCVQSDMTHLREKGFPSVGEISEDALISLANQSLKEYGETLSSALWKNTRQLTHNVIKCLSRSIILGEHPKKLVKVFDNGRYNAQRLLITETAKIQTEITKKIYDEYGVEYYQVITEPTACHECKQYGDSNLKNAPKYKIEDGIVGVTMPPFHPNCRCAIVNYIEGED